MPYDIPTLEKQPADSLLYDMEFVGRLAEGETLTAVSSVTAAPSGLTVGTPSYSGTRAQVRLGGGTGGVTYKVTIVVTTSASNTIEGEGNLFVRDS